MSFEKSEKMKKKHFTKRDDVFSCKNVLILNDIQAEFSFLYPFEISTEPWKKRGMTKAEQNIMLYKTFFFKLKVFKTFF